jgi:hypothetical protein
MRSFKTLLIIFILHLAFSASSQETILDRFQAKVNNRQVLLSWTIEQGSTCNGIAITRSSDSLNFTEIGDIEGVCGSISEPVNYSFTDINPITNRKNYYRLELGDVGSSKIISIEVIALNNEGFYAFPNPGTLNTRIYFSNAQLQRAELELFSVNGSKTSEIFSDQDFFDVDLTGFNAGLYLFLIYTQNNKPVSGKIVVQ